MSALRPLAAAFGFLSRLPVGRGPVDPMTLGRSVAWFPLVGLVFGLALAVTARLLGDQVPASLVAAGLVALIAWLSGGLHLDGLADVVDGLSGGRGEPERTLRIMRDSHIGAHATAALALFLVAKVAAVHEILRADLTWALVAGPAVSRWCAVPLVLFFPYARPQGLGRAMSDHARPRDLLVATIVAAACVAWSGRAALLPAASAFAAALALALMMRRRIGGLTGDVYGAAIELAELVFLAAVACHPAR